MICTSAELQDGGDGVRFTVTRPAGERAAFVVRFEGKVYAYLNRCAHVPIELDWLPGRFFDDSRRYLICATHGALYGRLEVLPVVERDGGVFLVG